MSEKKPDSMNVEQKRIAIAEACGWIRNGWWWHKTLCPQGNLRECPNYPEDLNACHEMEKVLTPEQRGEYSRVLGLMVCTENRVVWPLLHATAAQRFEAFGLTLNLWT